MILLQERDVLILKRMLLMMFLLLRNIFRDRCNIGFTNTEHPISRLPRKFPRPLPAHPLRRIRLNHARNFRRGMRWPDSYQHVNMIVGPINNQRRPAHFANDSAEIGRQFTPKLRLNQSPSPQSGENKMKQNVARCVRQVSFALPGLSFVPHFHPRLTLWAALCRRFAVSHRGTARSTSQSVPIVSMTNSEGL